MPFDSDLLGKKRDIHDTLVTQHRNEDNSENHLPDVMTQWTEDQMRRMSQWGLLRSGSRLQEADAEWIMARFRARHLLAMRIMARSDEFRHACKMSNIFIHKLEKSGFAGSREVGPKIFFLCSLFSTGCYYLTHEHF